MNKTAAAACAIASLALTAVPAVSTAHHSFVGFYDQDRIVEITGIVTSVSWRNPHGSMTIDVTDETGHTVEWQIETGSISVLRARGTDRAFVEVGNRVRVAGEAALRSSTGLYARNMLLPGGEEVLLSIGISPRWLDADADALLEPQFDSAVAEAARRNADGIFRVWSTVFEDPDSFPMFKGAYPLDESAEAAKRQWDPSEIVQLGCEPKGMPSLMISPFPMELVRRGTDIVMRFEEDDAERVVRMSPGATRPAGFASLLGYSTGRWDGDTLVVETDGVNAKYFDFEGTPLSGAARFVERFTLNEDENRLDYRITVTDPGTFTESFELRRYWIWRPEVEVNAYECEA